MTRNIDALNPFLGRDAASLIAARARQRDDVAQPVGQGACRADQRDGEDEREDRQHPRGRDLREQREHDEHRCRGQRERRDRVIELVAHRHRERAAVQAELPEDQDRQAHREQRRDHDVADVQRRDPVVLDEDPGQVGRHEEQDDVGNDQSRDPDR